MPTHEVIKAAESTRTEAEARELQAKELEEHADILERAAPNRYRQSIADKRSRAMALRSPLAKLEAECRAKGWIK